MTRKTIRVSKTTFNSLKNGLSARCDISFDDGSDGQYSYSDEIIAKYEETGEELFCHISKIHHKKGEGRIYILTPDDVKGSI